MLALDQDERLGRLADEDVLALAAEQGRIVVTHNVRHFVPLARRFAEERRAHAGIVLLMLPHTAYGSIVRQLERAFAAHPAQDDWIDRVEFLGRDRS